MTQLADGQLQVPIRRTAGSRWCRRSRNRWRRHSTRSYRWEGLPELIQVCADSTAAAVAERELRALAEAGEIFPNAGKRLLTLTRDGAPRDVPARVIVQSAYEWLLGRDAAFTG